MDVRALSSRVGVWATAAGLAIAAPAVGQHTLDRNLQVGSGGINPSRPDFAQEVRFRNAIVTGNVPGGLSLRVDPGYRASGELQTSLGTNDLFNFRRDSLYSGLGGMGIRGTDALQYQFAALTGNTPPPGITGYPTVRRSGTAATASTLLSPDTLSGALQTDLPAQVRPGTLPDRIRDDTSSAIRSPAAYVASRDLRPTIAGVSVDQEGRQISVSVSPLRGIAYDQMDTRDSRWTGVPRDTLPKEGQADQRGTPAQDRPPGSAEMAVAPESLTAQPFENRVDRRVETGIDTRSPYGEVIDRIRKAAEEKGAEEKAAEDKAAREAPWQERLAELRTQLRGPRPDVREARPEEAPEEGKPKPPAKEAPDRRGGIPPETISLLRGAGEEVRTLAPAGFDPYAQAMKTAQDHLVAGRYFDAEERFTSALSTRPGDPMAAAGRVNAELGAGMFLSAAINLRSLLVEHPEMTAVRYASELMPHPDRMPVIMQRLNDLSAERGTHSADAGLLQAYLGYQTGNPEVTRRGLEAMARDQSSPQLARLGEMLRAVWLEGAPAPEPVRPAPAARSAPPAPAEAAPEPK